MVMKLYLVEIGGMRDGNLFESHEVHAMFASSEEQLIRDCQARFANAMRAAHLDGWIEIELADAVQPRPDGAGSFFIAELGRNSSRSVREEHDYRFLTADSWKDAVQQARRDAPGWHVDACIDLDALAGEGGYSLHRDLFGNVPTPQAKSRYLRFLDARQPA